MTQARSPIGSSGSLRIVDSTQIPTARTFNGVQGAINHMVDAVEMLEITDGTLNLLLRTLCTSLRLRIMVVFKASRSLTMALRLVIRWGFSSVR